MFLSRILSKFDKIIVFQPAAGMECIDLEGFSQHSSKLVISKFWKEQIMWRSEEDLPEVSALTYGHRAAEAMDVPRVLDRTLEMIFSAAQDPNAKETVTKLRQKAQENKEQFLIQVAEIYSSVYTLEHLKALVEFLESSAGRSMREKQVEVEQKIKQATTEFLQSLVKENV